MEIKITYIGIDNKGIQGIWCGFKPENVIITEERKVLYPEKGKILHQKNTENYLKSVWLQYGDTEENYEEIQEGGTNGVIE